MAIPQSAGVLHLLRQSLLRYDDATLTDGQLLRSFLYRSDEAAFEALVRRHGPMVRGVCRRVLRNFDDADDTFQAAFLVLIRKASTLATREVLGDWLHGVAYRTALKARAAASRRRMKEKKALRHESFYEHEDRSEWLPLLDEEIGRLPPKYRLPVVLCDLEGRTRKEAAQHLGWPEGTVSGRLSRARAMLARRLTRRGLTLSAAALATGMAGEASARLPLSVARSICKAVLEYTAASATEAIPAHVAALTEGVVKAMFVSKLKNTVALVMVALILTAGAGAWRYAAVAGQIQERPPKKTAPTADAMEAVKAPKILPHPVPAVIVPEPDAPQSATTMLPPVPRVVFTNRMFRIDLQVHGFQKNGERKLLSNPTLVTLEGRPASFAQGDTRTIPLGGGKTEQVLIGSTIRVTVRSGKGEDVTLDVAVTRTQPHFDDCTYLETKTARHIIGTTLGSRVEFAVGGTNSTYTFGDSSAQATLEYQVGDKNSVPLVVSVGVQEAKPDTGEKKIFEAEKYLKMAECWRRTGHLVSALLYYEELSNEYPGTIYAERARERTFELEKQLLSKTAPSEAERYLKNRLIESRRQAEKPQEKLTRNGEKPPARIWRVFIVGNQKISDEVILEKVKLYPGQILTYPDLQIAEKNLSRLKGLKSNPKVTVIDHEDEFKDIRITVEEK